ncbi:MAG: hypothetical protein WCL06_08585 [Bacteroidota bacterium]
MKNLRTTLLLTLLGSIIILFGCKKTWPKVDFVPSEIVVKYKITLAHDTIKEIATYHNAELYSTKQYFFYDSVDEIIYKNGNGITTRKTILQIGSNGYAQSSVDSSFNDNGNFSGISASTFEYQDGFLTKYIIDTGRIICTYALANENFESSNVAYINWPSGCTDYYSYSSSLTTIDVVNFKNKIFGKPSRNLREHAGWQNGCPCGPSSNPASSDFTYEFNDNGWVTKIQEYYTPCYHSDTKNLTGTINTILIEYY